MDYLPDPLRIFTPVELIRLPLDFLLLPLAFLLLGAGELVVILSLAGDSVSWLWLEAHYWLSKPSSKQREPRTSRMLPVETDKEDEPAMLGPASTNDPSGDVPLVLSTRHSLRQSLFLGNVSLAIHQGPRS